MWYQTWFDQDEYAVVYNKRNDEDANQLLILLEKTLSLAPKSRILDMACGRGRHAIRLAEQGYEVLGIDLSPRSIAAAEERANKLNLNIRFKVADMRVAVDEQFDAVFNLFSSFGYFDAEAEHLQALSVMKDALVPNGVLVQDFMNADYVEKHLVPFDERTEQNLTIRQERWIEAGRINKRITLLHEKGEQVFNESVALLRFPDFERMYAQLGLTILNRFGDYQGNPFSQLSPRLILCARKSPVL